MLSRYKVRLIKKYDFDLDGKSEKDIKEQVDYIMNHTKILEMPYVKKRIQIKIKKIYERRNYNYEKNN